MARDELRQNYTDYLYDNKVFNFESSFQQRGPVEQAYNWPYTALFNL